MTRAEVVVIGAGPAGIAAATAAAEHGRSVVVLDDNHAAGGQIWRAATVRGAAGPLEDRGPRQRALERLRRSGAKVLPGRTVFNADPGGTVQALCEPAAGSDTEAFHGQRLILATGARERFLPFPGWTLPGVFGAGGLQALVRGGYPVAAKRVVVAGTGPLLLAVAAHLAEDGAQVQSVLEQASLSQLARFAGSLCGTPAKLLEGARYRARLWRSSYRTGCWVTEALGASDGQGLRAVRITDGRRCWEQPCELLAVGYHLVANTEIAQLLGCGMQDGFVKVDQTQQTSLANVYCAGEPTGIAGLDAALLEGEIAGLACAGQSTGHLAGRARRARAFGRGLDAAFALRPELRGLPQADTIVCRCEDVHFAHLSGRHGWTDTKLQTRCGMGPCQGRVCGPAVEFLLGWKPASVRPPIFPVPLEALCGAEGQEREKKMNHEKEKV